MNIKLKAAAITVGAFAGAALAANVLAALAANLTAEQVASIFSWGWMAFLAFCFYKLMLINLECKEMAKERDEATKTVDQ